MNQPIYPPIQDRGIFLSFSGFLSFLNFFLHGLDVTANVKLVGRMVKITLHGEKVLDHHEVALIRALAQQVLQFHSFAEIELPAVAYDDVAVVPLAIPITVGPGTTAALALLNDAVKKGGVMASSHVGGLSGAFIPVSEDEGMIAAVRRGSLSIEKLEAMTCVCSVGLDMIVVPGDTSASTISAIIADEIAIGTVNNKTTAVRIIPAPGLKEGDTVEFGGLLGEGPVMRVNPFGSEKFIARGGRIPAPIHSLRN